MTAIELKKLRNSLGLSLAQASRQVEVNIRTWVRWESGERKVPETAAKLFKLLNGVDRFESEELGNDPAHFVKAPAEVRAQIEAALNAPAQKRKTRTSTK